MTHQHPTLPLSDALAYHHGEAVSRATLGWLAGFASPNTRRTYWHSLQVWHDWARSHNVDVLEPDRASIQVWLAELRERHGASVSTIRVHAAALASWLAALSDAGTPEPLRSASTPLARIRLPHRALPDYEQLSTDQVRTLLATAPTVPGAASTALALLVTAGLRAAEVGSIDATSIRTTPWGPCIALAASAAKGGREALLPCHPSVLAAADTHGWPGGGHRSASTPAAGAARVRRWVTLTADAARVRLPSGRHPTPHDFRHWFVTTALAAGVPIHLVQDAARHADPSTTRRYDRMAGSVAGIRTVTDAVCAALGDDA